jgi:Tfp pilus assembly protein PilF
MNSPYFARTRLTAAFVLVFAHFVFGQQPRVPANFSLQINGQVRYAGSHQPAERVLVRIESFSGGLINQATTDRGGKFSFTGLTPMQYIVTVHYPGFVDVQQTVDLLTSNSGYLNVELRPDSDAIGASRDPRNDTALRVIDAKIPADAQTEYAKGQTALYGTSSTSAADAVKNFEKAVSIYPKYLEAQIMLGLAYMDQQQWQKAEKPFQAAIAINPQATTAYLALAEAFYRQKKYAEGEKALLDVLKVNADIAQAHFTLAKIYWDRAPFEKDEAKFRQDAESAWKEVSRALQIDAQLADAHLLAGNMLLKARRAPDALLQFEEYLKLSPNGQFAGETSALVKKIKDSLSASGKTN